MDKKSKESQDWTALRSLRLGGETEFPVAALKVQRNKSWNALGERMGAE